MKKDTEKEQIFCNYCTSETNHLLRQSHGFMRQYSVVDNIVQTETWAYRMWMCAGCEHATLEIQRTTWTEPPGPQNPEVESWYFPKRREAEHYTRLFRRLPAQLERIYEEAVGAFNENLHILCAAGLRALVEGICADKGVEGKNLEKKIDGLTPHLPENIVKNIHSLRFIGNDALHELKPPSAIELRLALEVSEDLLNFLYDLDYKTELLALRRHGEKSGAAKKLGDTSAKTEA